MDDSTPLAPAADGVYWSSVEAQNVKGTGSSENRGEAAADVSSGKAPGNKLGNVGRDLPDDKTSKGRETFGKIANLMADSSIDKIFEEISREMELNDDEIGEISTTIARGTEAIETNMGEELEKIAIIKLFHKMAGKIDETASDEISEDAAAGLLKDVALEIVQEIAAGTTEATDADAPDEADATA